MPEETENSDASGSSDSSQLTSDVANTVLGFLDSGLNLGFVPGFSGNYESTIGSGVGFSLGSKFDHVFGSESTLYCDPLDLLLGPLATNPAVAAILGTTGRTEFSYGSETSAHYVGRKYEIHRVPASQKNSDYDFSTPEGAAIAFSNANLSPTDLPVAQAAAILSLLMCLIALVMDLTLHFVYPKLGEPAEDGEAEDHGYGMAPQIINTAVVIIVSRIMAVIRILEMRAARVNLAEAAVVDGAAHADAGAQVLVAEDPPADAATQHADAAADDADEATEEAAGALDPAPP